MGQDPETCRRIRCRNLQTVGDSEYLQRRSGVCDDRNVYRFEGIKGQCYLLRPPYRQNLGRGEKCPVQNIPSDIQQASHVEKCRKRSKGTESETEL